MYQTPFHQEDISTKKFLITGGGGFIGSNIVEYLLKYNAGLVRVLDNFSTSDRKNLKPFIHCKNFELTEGDITNIADCRKACKGIDFVSHQAALGSVPRSVKDPITTHEVNANGFLNMLVAARDEKVKRMVYASSSSVYGDHPALPKREEDTGKPLSPYAVSKKINELYASVFASTYSMELIGLRYFNVFGPNQSPDGPYAAVIPLFMQAALNKKSPYIDGDGKQTRDFTFVENAVQANIKSIFATNPEACGKVYNVAVGERLSVIQLYQLIAKIGNSTAEPIHRETRAGDIRNSLADISRSAALLGYLPMVKAEEGLNITFAWYKNNLS